MTIVAMAMLIVTSVLLLSQEVRSRLLGLHITRVVAGRSTPSSNRLTGFLSDIGARYKRFYSPESIEELRVVVQMAGFNPHRTLTLLLGAKTFSMFLFPAIAIVAVQFVNWSSGERIVVVLSSAVLGIMLPRWILAYLRRCHNLAIQAGIPEAIDLLVVCSEAGMGLESALDRVSQEMRRSNAAIANMLDGLLDDLRVLPDRREAFANLATRSNYEGIRRLGTMLSQSMQYGTPLGVVLRSVADELRRERLVKLEERAHKLGVKLIIPMAVFLLPTMAIILGASSFLHLMDAFKAISH